MSKLGTIVTAMITPFGDAGVNNAEAARLAKWLVAHGNDGLVVGGSTGEGQTLDDDERNALFEAVKEAVGESACVIANTGTNETRASVRNTMAAERGGADAILAVVPYYNKPTQRGMIAHFSAIAESTRLPVIVYNIPGRTGANMLPATLLELQQRYDTIAGVKESSGDLLQIAQISRDRKPGFVLFAGDDHLFLPSLAVGADGVVGVASHLCAAEYRNMFAAYTSGNVAEATRIHLSLLPLIRALFATTNPIAVKWAMSRLGFATCSCRLPLDEIPDDAAAALTPLLAPYLVRT